MSAIRPKEPATPTMVQAKTTTTTVRTAVATSESVLRIPHLASIDVKPARRAEARANTSHIPRLPRLSGAAGAPGRPAPIMADA